MKHVTRTHSSIKLGKVAATTFTALALTLGSTAAIAQTPATPSTERMDDTNTYGSNRMAGSTGSSPTYSGRTKTETGTTREMLWGNKDTKPRSERPDHNGAYQLPPGTQPAIEPAKPAAK